MATKTLDIKLNLNAADPINGVLTLNDERNQNVNYNDLAVRTASISAPSASPSVLVAAVVSSTKVAYTYIKNTDTTNFLVLKNDAGQVWGRLLPGQFSMISVAEVAGLEIQADTAPVTVDYAVFVSP